MNDQTGKVKWFDRNKGFGFIVPDEGGIDVFMNANSFSDPDYIPMEGDCVSFRKEDARKRPGQFFARNVSRVMSSNRIVGLLFLAFRGK